LRLNITSAFATTSIVTWISTGDPTLFVQLNLAAELISRFVTEEPGHLSAVADGIGLLFDKVRRFVVDQVRSQTSSGSQAPRAVSLTLGPAEETADEA
jgi:hypothetical protein